MEPDKVNDYNHVVHLQDTFRCAVGEADKGNMLRESIIESISAQGLTPSVVHVSKCMQLHNALATRFGVILLGCAASGKTSLTQSLENALCHMACMQRAEGTQGCVAVRRHVINPKAYSLEDLYGKYEEATGKQC
jgi:hypothetical protein